MERKRRQGKKEAGWAETDREGERRQERKREEKGRGGEEREREQTNIVD